MIWETAVIENGYRYILPFMINSTGGTLAVIQINPSLANGVRLDPTAGKVKRWAEEKGFGTLYLLNFYATISPKQELIERRSYRDLVGPRNNEFIESATKSATTVIATGKPCGVLAEYYGQRLREIRELLRDRPIHRVGDLTKEGYPRHGRSWNKGNRQLLRYSWQ